MTEDWEVHLAALAAPEQPETAFASLNALMLRRVGATLFTVMIHDLAQGKARRIYSNMPEQYAIGGWKPIVESDYSRTVIHNKSIWVNNTHADIRSLFSDHELIRSLGCESSCHVPVVLGGELFGTLNLLGPDRFFTPDKLQAAADLRPFAYGALVLGRRQAGIDRLAA